MFTTLNQSSFNFFIFINLSVYRLKRKLLFLKKDFVDLVSDERKWAKFGFNY